MYFNGNLFRDSKAKKILNFYSREDTSKLEQIDERLSKKSCINASEIEKLLGTELYMKDHSIALLDVNPIGKEKGIHRFVTKPSPFSKYSNSTVKDPFHLAKAPVTSLTYGMKCSPQQGHIFTSRHY